MNMALPPSFSILKQLLVFLVTLSILGCTRGYVMCTERERQALLDFKKSFVVSYPHRKLSSWKSSEKDCCIWGGIICDNHTRHVISLDLSDDGLDGYQLRPSLLQLRHLRSLNLSFNNFIMRMPGFIGSFSKLKHLDFYDASFSGRIPPHLGNLSNIQTLNLGNNRLSSDTFVWLSHLSSLRKVDLSSTNFSEARDWLSTIRNLPFLSSFSCSLCSLPPPIFSSAPSQQVNSSKFLKTLDLSGNILYSSTISWLINSTSNLSELDLEDVNLAGSFPNLFQNRTSLEWLSHLSSLTTLDLSYANFSHVKDWLSTIRKLPLLASFTCVECSFASPILSSTPHHVDSFTSLKILYLSSSNLSLSTISTFLNSSSNLSELGLQYLNLEGPFPDLFQNMISLKTLHLSGTQLEGGIFKSIGNMCNLKELHADGSGLKRSLSNVLQDLSSCASSSLESLHLEWNNLTGVVPPMLKFGSLTELYLDVNNLDSFQLQNSTLLPKHHASNISSNELSNGSLRNILPLFPAGLSTLSLSSNSLTGVLSDSHFSNFSNLIYLYLSDNPTLTISFSKPPLQLKVIILRSCNLGPSFPRWLLAQNSFTALAISNSSISDSVPFSFWRNLPPSLITLDLSHNNLSGRVPNLPFSFSFSDFLLEVDLSSNAFYGTIPFSFFKASTLLLSKNNFSGFAPLPHSNNFSKPSDVSSKILDFSDNSLSGKVPYWFWSLVHKSTALNLANNCLSGTIPKSIGDTSDLQALSLSNNSFSGLLPLWLKNCSNLSILDLSWNRFSGLIPTWMGEELKILGFLSLKSNNLTGSIPANICHLKSLQILDLSYNNLSGGIPSAVHKFTAMAHDDLISSLGEITVTYDHLIYDMSLDQDFYYLLVRWKGMYQLFDKNLQLLKLIDLSNNNLSGEIPSGMTSLLGLKSLDLSRNNLRGRIPEEIGHLKSLEVLNLSCNRLSGHIPSSLANISSLEILDFSYNNLSGRIPKGTQLQILNASAFADNLGLCGSPLPIECPEDGIDPVEAPQPSATNGGDKWSDKESFDAGLGTGFAFGFLTILGTLALIRKWRYAFYRSVDDFTNWILVHVELSISRASRKIGLK